MRERMTDEEITSLEQSLWGGEGSTVHKARRLIEALKAERAEVARLKTRNDVLEGRTVNGVAPESWPPNRRTPEDSNAKAVALMRQHVASYKSIDAHRHNCLDLCRRLEAAEAKLRAVWELPGRWKKEAVTPVETDEGYCINGAYQVCAHELEALLKGGA